MIYGGGGLVSTVLASGELTIPRCLCFNGGFTMTSGTLLLTYFTAQKTETSTRVITRTGGTAAAGLTTGAVGVYSFDGTTFTLQASVSDTTLWAATNTAYTRNWSSPFAKVAGQTYAFAALAAGTTMPSLCGAGLDPGFASAAGIIGSSAVAEALSGQSALPASILLSATVNTGNVTAAVIAP